MYASLTYRDVQAAVAWLIQAFGFDADLQDNGIGTLRYSDGRVIVQPDQPRELHGSHVGQGWVYTVVEDVDAHHQHAAREGAHILGPPHGDGDGFRGYSARDLEGNLWSFGTGPAD